MVKTTQYEEANIGSGVERSGQIQKWGMGC